MLQCKYTYSQDTLLSGKSCKSLLLSQTIYLMIKLMMEDVMGNFAFSTNGSKLCSFFVKSVLELHDKWKLRLNLIILWCRIPKKKFAGNVTFSTNQCKAVLKCWHFWPMRIRFSPHGGCVVFWGFLVIFSLLINQT